MLSETAWKFNIKKFKNGGFFAHDFPFEKLGDF